MSNLQDEGYGFDFDDDFNLQLEPGELTLIGNEIYVVGLENSPFLDNISVIYDYMRNGTFIAKFFDGPYREIERRIKRNFDIKSQWKSSYGFFKEVDYESLQQKKIIIKCNVVVFPDDDDIYYTMQEFFIRINHNVVKIFMYNENLTEINAIN